MTKTKPRITIHFLKLMYLLSRNNQNNKNKVHCAYGGKMDEGEYQRCLTILNELKNGK